MYAQLIQGGTSVQHRPEMDALVREQLLPALEQEPGYAGAMNLVDRADGQALMIVLWETEAQANRPLPDYGEAFLRALAAITAISTGQREPMSVWDVNVDARVLAAAGRP